MQTGKGRNARGFVSVQSEGERMKAKEYLNGVRRMQLKCIALKAKADEFERLAGGAKAIDYSRDKVQTSPANKMEEYSIKAHAIREKLTREIEAYRKKIKVIQRQIDGIQNQTYWEVLTYRYMTDDDGRQMSLEKIACKMSKSYEWVRHVHGAALQEFERRYLQ